MEKLGIRPEVLHLLEENVTLHYVILGTDFLNKTPKAQEVKSRINKWIGIKLKSFFTTKEIIKNMKREPTEWEKIFANCTSDRALISRTFKELKSLNTKN